MPNHVSNSVRLILKPFLFDYTITKDAQVKRLRLPRRKRGGKTGIPMQGLAGFAWGFLFLRLRDGGGLFLAVVVFSSFFGGHPVATVPTAAVYAFTNKVGISSVIDAKGGAEHTLTFDFQSGEGGCDICFHFSCVVWFGPLPHARKAWGNGLLVD